MVDTSNQAEAKSPAIGDKPVEGASPKKLKAHERYNSDDADIVLVSSDGVEFRVHSYRLQAASSVFRDLLSIPPIASQARSPITLTDTFLEHSWVLESLLDVVYHLDFYCLKDYTRARAVIDLAEKWGFEHATDHMTHRFLHERCDGDGLSMKRLTLSMALNMSEPAMDCVRTWRDVTWGPGRQKRPGDIADLIQSENRYLYDKPNPNLLKFGVLPDVRAFNLGTWAYRSFLELSPTTAWALLRAQHLATTEESEVDGKVFEEEFRKLLDIIMPDEVPKPASS